MLLQGGRDSPATPNCAALEEIILSEVVVHQAIYYTIYSRKAISRVNHNLLFSFIQTQSPRHLLDLERYSFRPDLSHFGQLCAKAFV